MEKTENLTNLQQDLINGLINEFTKINPKPTNGKARFGFDTINECLKEEERFKQTITKHNMTMMKVFVEQLKNDVNEFEQEFGKVLKIELGYFNHCQHNTLEMMVEQTTKNPLGDNKFNEVRLFFVSKTKERKGDYNYFGYCYHGIYVDFKREKATIKLTSGKEVGAFKIVGLEYNKNEWLHRDKDGNVSFSTLDEFVQTNKLLQQKIIELTN